MKKLFKGICIIALIISAMGPMYVSAATKKSSAASPKTTMKWSPAALKQMKNLRGFDYSTAIRDSYMRKVERYAKRKHLTLITPAVINGMRE